MAFGENVGSAYVKLYADGDGVPDDIRKAMEKIEPEFEKAGKEHAEAFDKAWNKQREQDSPKMRDNLAKDLQKGLGRFGAIGEQLGSDFFDGIQIQLSRELEDNDLGQQIRENLEAGFERSGSFDQLRNQLRDLNGEILRASDQLDQKFEKELRDAVKETDDLTGSTVDWRKSVEDTRDAMRELAGEIDNGWDRTNHWVREMAVAREESTGFTVGFRDRLHSLNTELDKSATLTGRIFGKGSRNDFLNIVGGAVEGLTRIVYSAPNLLEKLLGGGGAGGGPGGAISLLSGVASSIVGIAIAVGAVVAVAGPIAALISGISAAAIALVGSLAFAAAGVGAVALVLAGPLAVGLGVVVAALVGMDDQTRKMVNGSVDDLINKFTEAGDAAGEAFGPKLARAVALAEPALDGLSGFFAEVGSAIGDITINLAEMTQSRGFADFKSAFGDFIPGALRDIGDIVGNTLGGIGGVLEAAIPITQRFLDWMVKVTDEFSEWANSAQGQEELLNFFDDAADSAIAVWDAVRDISEAIIDLLDQGKDTGDDIFTTLAGKAQEFVDWLNDPANQDAIASFFENGKETAESLGNLVLDLQQLIDDFDTEETRQELQDIFDLVGQILNLIGEGAGAVTAQWNTLMTVLEGVLWFFEEIGKAAQDTGELIVDAVRAPDRALTKLSNGISGLDWGGMANAAGEAFTNVAQDAADAQSKALGWFRGLGGRIKTAIGRVDWSSIILDPTGKVIGWFKGLASRLVSAAGDVDWGDVVKDPTGKILGWFQGLGGRIVSAIGNIDINIDWPSPPSWFSKVAGAVTPNTAIGGVFGSAQVRRIAEAGPEAVVPLNRPLDQVDPSVRGLSAIAQGLAGPGGGITVAEGAIVVHEVGNGRATAAAVLNALVAKAA